MIKQTTTDDATMFHGQLRHLVPVTSTPEQLGMNEGQFDSQGLEMQRNFAGHQVNTKSLP